MATMYVTEQGAQVEKEYQRLLVTKEDEVLMRVPLARVSHVVLVGAVGVTTPAMIALLEAGVGLSLISRSGQLRGQLMPPTAKNIPLRQEQYARAQDASFCLALSRSIVMGKLRNLRALARRLCLARPQIDATRIAGISAALRAASVSDDLATLRGAEGQGSRAYFAIFRQALPEAWHFEKRARRPPPNPTNALLSLGYTILTQNLMAACEIVGLDPYEGFFHADKYGRPALALDLVEEFRSIVVDSVVMTIINKRILNKGDFRPGPKNAVYLTDKGLREFFRQYAARLNSKIIHPYYQRPLTYQQCFEVQARLLRKVIEGELAEYPPFRVR